MPKTAAPSNWLRTLSGLTTVPASTAVQTFGNVHLPFAVDLDFHDGRDVSEEAAMRGDAEAVSRGLLLLSPI